MGHREPSPPRARRQRGRTKKPTRPEDMGEVAPLDATRYDEGAVTAIVSIILSTNQETSR